MPKGRPGVCIKRGREYLYRQVRLTQNEQLRVEDMRVWFALQRADDPDSLGTTYVSFASTLHRLVLKGLEYYEGDAFADAQAEVQDSIPFSIRDVEKGSTTMEDSDE